MAAAITIKFSYLPKCLPIKLTHSLCEHCLFFPKRSLFHEVQKMSYITHHSLFVAEHNMLEAAVQIRNFNFTPLNGCFPCWNCMTSLSADKFFCDKCQVIQQPSSNVNYFKLFSLSPSFDVDSRLLATKFKNMQKLLHPDKFTLKTANEIKIAEEYSSLVNKAYLVLKAPWPRGVYLLKIKGTYVEEETTVDDPELLMTVMERNEELAMAKDVPTLLGIDKVNKRDLALVIMAVSEAFRKDDLETAKKLIYKLKYLSNIEEKVNEKKLMLGVIE